MPSCPCFFIFLIYCRWSEMAKLETFKLSTKFLGCSALICFCTCLDLWSLRSSSWRYWSVVHLKKNSYTLPFWTWVYAHTFTTLQYISGTVYLMSVWSQQHTTQSNVTCSLYISYGMKAACCCFDKRVLWLLRSYAIENRDSWMLSMCNFRKTSQFLFTILTLLLYTPHTHTQMRKA